jgi:hypothetical protein
VIRFPAQYGFSGSLTTCCRSAALPDITEDSATAPHAAKAKLATSVSVRTARDRRFVLLILDISASLR